MPAPPKVEAKEAPAPGAGRDNGAPRRRWNSPRAARWVAIGLLATVAAVPIAIGQLEKRIEAALVQAARDAGLDLAYEESDFRLVGGAVDLRGLTVTEHGADQPLIASDRLRVDIGIAELLRGEPLWADLKIAGGSLTLNHEGRTFPLTDLHLTARLDESAGRIEVADARARAAGWDLSLEATIELPAAPTPAPTTVPPPTAPAPPGDNAPPAAAPAPPQPRRSIASLIAPWCAPFWDWLEVEHSPLNQRTGTVPNSWAQASLTLEVATDGEASLYGNAEAVGVRWRGLRIASLYGGFSSDLATSVAVPVLSVSTGNGSLEASAEHDLTTGTLEVRGLETDTPPLPVLAAIGVDLSAELEGFAPASSPAISAQRLEVDTNDPGLVAVEGAAVEFQDNVTLRDGETELIAERLSARDIQISDRGRTWSVGEVTGSLDGLDFSVAIGVDATAHPPATDGAVRATGAPPQSPEPAPPADPTTDGQQDPPATDRRLVPSGPTLAALRRLCGFQPVAGGARPSLSVRVDVDGGRVTAEGKLEGTGFRWQGEEFGRALVPLAWDGEVVSVQEAELDGGEGVDARARFSLTFTPDTLSLDVREAEIERFDLGAFLSALPGAAGAVARRIEFSDELSLRAADVRARIAPFALESGQLHLHAPGATTYDEDGQQFEFGDLELALSADADRGIDVSGFSGRLGGLAWNFRGEIPRPGTDRGTGPAPPAGAPTPDTRTSNSIDTGAGAGSPEPAAPVPATERPSYAPFLAGLDVETPGDPLMVTGQFRWDTSRHGLAGWSATAGFSGEALRWRDLRLESASGAIAFADGVISVPSLDLRGHGGRLVAEGSFRPRDGRVQVHHFRSDLDPIEFARALGATVSPPLSTLEFSRPPSIVGRDFTFIPSDAASDSFTVQIDVPAPVRLALTEHVVIELDRLSTRAEVRGYQLFIDKAVAQAYGGSVSLTGDFSVLPGDRSGGISVTAKDVSVRKLRAALHGAGSEGESGPLDQGAIQFTFEGTHRGSFASTTGSGRVDIEARDLDSVPFLGGFTDILGSVLPSLFSNPRNWQLEVPFTMAGGTLDTTRTRFTGGALRISGWGTVDFANDHADLTAQLNPRGLVGLTARIYTLGMIDQILMVRGSGPLDGVEWRLSPLARRSRPRGSSR